MRFFILYILIVASYALAIALSEQAACDLLKREVDCVDCDPPQAYFFCATRFALIPRIRAATQETFFTVGDGMLTHFPISSQTIPRARFTIL